MTDADDLDILICGEPPRVRFAHRCPMTWEALQETDSPRQRFCDHCERRVTWCHDAAEANLRALQGECIAVPSWFAEGARERLGDDRIVIGRPDYLETFAAIVETRAQGDAPDDT